MSETKMLTVSVPESLYQKIENLMKQTGEKKSKTVVKLMTGCLENQAAFDSQFNPRIKNPMETK